jgi:hypothetical protein
LTLISACYAPKVRNDGYACDPADSYSCPDGFQCIDGVCDDGHDGQPPARDLAMSMPEDMAHVMPAPNEDMAHGQAPDGMAQPTPDMAQPTPDMAQACLPTGADCGGDDSVCCSLHCRGSTWTCR